MSKKFSAQKDKEQAKQSSINWYPGHMHKGREELKKVAKRVDIVLELLDARIPISSRNRFFPEVIKNKPKLILLTKSDLADISATENWRKELKNSEVLEVLAINNKDLKSLKPLQNFLQDYAQKQPLKKITALVVGVPNLGKSSLINNLAGRKVAQTANEPGVTRGQNFIKINDFVSILDTPGILWGKIEDELTGELLAINSVIKSSRFDNIEICLSAIEMFKKNYPKKALALNLNLDTSSLENLEEFARKNAAVRKGGELDLEKAALLFLNNLRNAKFGAISWEFVN